MKPVAEALLLAAACGLLYLTGAGDIPFYTRGEPREALVVREMTAGGPWLVPERPDGSPTRKPPLYYWTAAVAWEALPGRPELAMRLPNALLASAAVLGIWAAARGAWGAPAALPAALVLATGFEWTRAATSARVDMALAAALTAVLAGWTLALAGRSRGWWLLAALGVALGTLAKGPVAIVLPALVAVVLRVARRDAGLRGPLAAVGAGAAVAACWYAVALARGGRAFLAVVASENWLRFLGAPGGELGHAHGPGYLLAVGLVGLLPWVPLLPLALVAWRAQPRATPVALAAAWLATGLVFFSLSAGKRSVYLLPLHPALALLVGAGAAAAGDSRLARRAAAIYPAAFLVLAAAAAALGAGIDPTPLLARVLKPRDAAGAEVVIATARAAAPLVAATAIATAAGAWLSARALHGRAWRRLVLVVAALMVLWTAAFDGVFHPAIARARSLAAFMARVDARVPSGASLWTRFPPDPGLRFYAPRPLRPWRGRALPEGYTLLWENEWDALHPPSPQTPPLVASETARPRRGRLLLLGAPPP
jgi:4-amino-4-deoxy-L-arabinose transferase-like glycosyltransferase